MLAFRSYFNHHREGGILSDLLVIFAVGVMLFGGVALLCNWRIEPSVVEETPDRESQLRNWFVNLPKEIAGAGRIEIGDHEGGPFATALYGSPQAGSAIRIYNATNDLVFVEYRLRALDNRPYLQRIVASAGRMKSSEMVCLYVPSEDPVFTAMSSDGRTVLRIDDTQSISVSIDFWPQGAAGTNESVHLETAVPYQHRGIL